MIETKHVAQYLPHDVCFTDGNRILRLKQINVHGEFKLSGETHVQNLKFSKYQIMLRPASDISKEIEPGFNPIVELAKIAGLIAADETNWRIAEGSLIFQKNGKTYAFYYSGTSFSCHTLSEKEPEYISIPLQTKLFKLLYHLHFEVDIPKGSWIEITE